VDYDLWPNCIVDGCPRKCCLALDSDKCFPHTPGNSHIKGWKIDARNSVTKPRIPVRA
jgi:hypothetical protein